jgi:predicted enzyme related to lactoylglutathione lyase
MKNPIAWFEIYVNDMKRAKKFYESVLGMEMTSLANPATAEQSLEMWAFPGDMSTYGATGALAKMEGFPGGNNSVIVYFHSDDCAIEEKKVVQHGGKIIKNKMSLGPHGFMCLASDTENNVVGFHSMK